MQRFSGPMFVVSLCSPTAPKMAGLIEWWPGFSGSQTLVGRLTRPCRFGTLSSSVFWEAVCATYQQLICGAVFSIDGFHGTVIRNENAETPLTSDLLEIFFHQSPQMSDMLC